MSYTQIQPYFNSSRLFLQKICFTTNVYFSFRIALYPVPERTQHVVFFLGRGHIFQDYKKNLAILDKRQKSIYLSFGEITADRPTQDVFNDDALLARSGLERPLRMQAICTIPFINTKTG